MTATHQRSRRRPEALASQLIQEHNLPIGFDVAALAQKLGARVLIEWAPDDVSGALVSKGGRPVILANEKHPPVRQRFSIAHELGHLLLHASDDTTRNTRSAVVLFRDERSTTGTHKQEIEANRFAASLLMPAEEVRRRVANRVSFLDEDFIAGLAREFYVSPQAMAYRLENLRLLKG